MTRRELREHLFKLLFRIEFNPLEDMEEQKALFLEEEPELEGEDKDELTGKYQKVLEHLSEIDSAINEKAEGWNTGRMGKVELTIIRLALYEILYDEAVPEGVAINEAVLLAKKYGQDQASGFVNGVLAKFVTQK